jgi:hypothetical protein
MKIKKDFVTNSSSTSFIITCEVGAMGKDEFIDKINRCLENYIKERAWDEEFQEPPLLKSDMVNPAGSGVFIIKDFVPIYCGEEDMPQYIKELFLDKDSDAGRLLKNSGINPIRMEIKDLNK